MRELEGARAALQSEWDKLRRQKVWGEAKVRPWAQVVRESRASSSTIHVGRIFEICVEKNAELPLGDPRRKFKGRVVFQGNQFRDQGNEEALGSSPATMEAGKSCDCYSLFPGHAVEQADAESAYTQSRLGGSVVTWVRLPMHQWPPEWEGITDPVSPLVLALYGHPDAGGYWERHCEQHLVSVGFAPIPTWKSCFFHAVLKLFLLVYVDDFKMAGPKESLADGWNLIRRVIKMDDPAPMGHCLVCTHEEGSAVLADGTSVRTMTYNMQPYFEASVDLCRDLIDPKVKWRRAATPFLEESAIDSARPSGDGPWTECPQCAGRFPDSAFSRGVGEKITTKVVPRGFTRWAGRILHRGSRTSGTKGRSTPPPLGLSWPSRL
jgi:hypothetical protein